MKDNQKKRTGLRALLYAMLSFMMVWTMIPGMLSTSTAYAAAGDTPAHTKSLTDNEDGTYTLSLDVKGESEKKAIKTNVIVVLDKSGSMDDKTGGYGSESRMTAAKRALNSLASTLLAYNGVDGNPEDTFEMALVTFSNVGGLDANHIKTASDFASALRGVSPDGGTNWEDGLKTASEVDFGDNDQTFVIFVSDGNPTFRNTRGNYSDYDLDYNWDYYNYYGIYGTGSESNATTVQRCYDHAVDDAKAIVQKVGANNFYTIGAYGNVDRMKSLTTAAGAPSGNYFSASNTSQLEAALKKIVDDIQKAGFADVEIDDGTTNQVATSSGVAELLKVDESSYKYYRDGVEWKSTDDPAPPEAKLVNGEVQWDLSSLGVLDNGVTYKVTFDVYPSQYTYDTIAKLKNGDITYDSLDENLKKYIVKNGDSYSLATNTVANLTYDDTRDEAGEQTKPYDNPDPVATDASELTINKVWEGGTEPKDPIEMTVLMGDEPFHTVELKGNSWSAKTFISVGIIKNGKALTGAEGHDFSFAELDSTQYRWELDAATVHPMLVDGTLTMLVKVDADHPAPTGAATYTINGSTYYVDAATTGLTATNYRRSNLNLTKAVNGENADPDELFPFSITVNNSKAENGSADDTSSDHYVWFAIQDKDGNVVKDATISGATAEIGKDGNPTGYYYAESGSAVTAKLKAGWNLRFTNLPTGTTYSITESDVTGYPFNKAELTEGNDTTFKDGKTSTGTIEETKTSYTVKYTNDYEKTKVEAQKVWDDAENQDNIRPASVSVQLKANGTNKGDAVTLDASNSWKNTWTDLPKYKNGEKIAYTVEETAVSGYTTTYAPITDAGVIEVTNKHTPEETEFTVTKKWDDTDFVGKGGYERPSNLTVKLVGEVTVDGTTSTVNNSEPVTVGTADDWSYKWDKLPKYKDGIEIAYKVIESGASEAGYEPVPSDPVQNEETGAWTSTVTNTPVEKKEEYTPVDLKIVKQDAITSGVLEGAIFEVKNAEGKIIANATTDKNGEATITFTEPGTYNMTETAPTGYDSPTPGSWDIVVEKGALKSVTFKPGTEEESGFWSWLYDLVFGDGTDYKNGTLIVKDPPKTENVEVKKIWSDSSNQDGKRPASVTYQLYKKVGEAEPVAVTGQTKTLTGEGDQWTATFENLPTYEDGKPVTYTIKEMNGSTPVENGGTLNDKTGEASYTAEYSNNDLTVTNKYETETVTVDAAKVWDDKDFENKAGYERPTEVKFNLLADGTKIDSQTKTVNKDSDWKATWSGLDKYKNGTEIAYTVTEDILDNYTTVVTGDADKGFTVTNTPKTAELDTTAAIQKTVVADGTKWADKTFKFTITAGKGAPAPEKTSAELKFSKAGTQDIDFGKIVFTHPGTYEYTVTEEAPGNGWECKTSPQTVTVKVDNKDGKLVATVEKQTITNTYKPSGDLPTATTAVLKKVVEAPDTANFGENGKTFDFEISAAEGTPMPTKTKGTATFKNGEALEQIIDFGTITYTKAGTYEYTVTETTKSGNGWTCDNDPKTVTVKVEDNGDGTLTATPTAATITNKYEPKGDLDTSAKAVLTKTVEGEGFAEKTFDFEISAAEGTPMPKNTKGSATFTEAGTKTISFGTITYSKAGTYTYKVKETTKSGDGWTCDNTEKTVTVEVVDNGDGTLTAKPTKAEITNVYNTKGELDTKVSPVLTKTVTADGKEWAPKTFDFTIAAVDGAPLGKDKDGKEITKASATFDKAGTQNIDFGVITYTKAGTYKYTVAETTKSGEGWVCDNEAKEVVVTVKDDGKGNLTATVKAANIENKYEPEGKLDTDASALLTKKVTADGKEWAPKKFDFEIAAVDGAPLAKDEDGKDITKGSATFNEAGEKTIDFGEIKYTKAGTYKYTVTETTKSGEGWVCDNEAKDVVVTVTDDGKGNLTAEVTTKAQIENKYEPSGNLDTETDIMLYKNVVAPDTANFGEGGKTFDFTISAEEGTPMPSKTSGSATFTEAGTKPIGFGTITYSKAGTYTYTITETTQSGNGWTCDNAPKTVTVNVKDNGDGTLTATVAKAETIKNEYKPEGSLDTKTNAVLTKTVEATGTAWAPKKFDFTIAAVTPGAPEPTKKSGTATFNEAGTQTIDFGTITFSKAGEYEYSVAETTQSGEGWTCDNEAKTVKITVVDNGDGTLTATPAAVDIKNVYEAKPVKTQIKVTKTVTGYKTEEGSADDNYVMILTGKNDAPMPETAQIEVATTNGAGEGLFGEIEYTATGTYEYTVTEKKGDKAGVTYDETTYDVTVTVTDDGKGHLVAEVNYGGAGSATAETGEDTGKTSVDVTNEFAVESVDVVMSVTKQIDDQSNSAEDATFKFVLKDADKNELQTKEVTTENFKGSVDFDAIKFDHDGEYTFYIQESVSEEDAAKLGWTYDTNEYPVVVKISDNLSEAKLVKDGVAYDNDKTELVVTNIYKAEPVTVSDITVKKTIEDTSGSAYETTFTFTLTAGDNDVEGYDTPMPENSKASVTGEGEVTFAGIKYEKAGTYNYTVTEEATGDAGYEYDTTTYDVKVVVTDEGGKLVAKVDYGTTTSESGEEVPKTNIEVVNTYDPEDATAQLTATKLINDKTGSAPDATFTFELLDADGNVVETVEHQNAGTITFKQLTFSKVGTYKYTIREVAGSTPGYTYDTTEHPVTITVTDPDKDGLLKAKVEGNNPEIENPYSVDPGKSSVTDQISVTKKLTGRDLEDGEFDFELRDADGKVVGTGTNEGSTVTFPALTFKKVGTYLFTVNEVEGAEENVTYDGSVYSVKAIVTDPHDGSALQVEWTTADGKIVFHNSYEEEVPPHKDVKTGDDNNLTGWLAVMALAGAGGTGILIKRRREED